MNRANKIIFIQNKSEQSWKFKKLEGNFKNNFTQLLFASKVATK